MIPVAAGHIRVEVEAAVCAEPELAALEAGAAAGQAPAPGGAAVGRVIEAGEGAGELAGARVLVAPLQPCGECDRCRRGATAACPSRVALGVTGPGALSGRIDARARWALRLDGGLELPGPLAALVAREAADAYALCARAGLGAGDRAQVVGGGPVAALARQVLRARGVREVAGEAGDAADQAMAIVCAGGDPPALASAIARSCPGALVVLLARGGGEAALAGLPAERLAGLLAGGGAVAGVPGAHPDLLPEVAALAARGELDLAAVAEVWRPEGEPLADPAALASRARGALEAGRALVVELGRAD